MYRVPATGAYGHAHGCDHTGQRRSWYEYSTPVVDVRSRKVSSIHAMPACGVLRSCCVHAACNASRRRPATAACMRCAAIHNFTTVTM